MLACVHIRQDELFEKLDMVSGVFWCNSAVDSERDYRPLKTLIKTILNNYMNPGSSRQLYECSLYYQLLDEIVRTFLVSDISDMDKTAADPEQRMDWILQYINQNYCQQINLQDMAKQLYLTPPYLSRMIKRKLGMNFNDYLVKVRLTHAVNDLIYSEEMITAIAVNNGFANASAFNKIFRERMQMTPGDFRRQHRSDKRQQPESNQNVIEIKDELGRYFTRHPFAVENKRCRTYSSNVSVKQVEPYVRNWNQMINMGCSADLLKYDVQQHVLHLQKILNIQYIRFWGIFSDQMYVAASQQRGSYNFDKITQVLDFLLDHGLKPFIELGDKPRVVHKAMEEDLVYQPNRSQPLELVEFQALFLAFLRYVINKYGVEEVETWFFELWRDDDIGGIKMQMHQFISRYQTEEEYFQWLGMIQYVIKRLVPGAKVGGGGFNVKFSRFSLTGTLKHFNLLDSLPDFWSLTVFPYDDARKTGSDKSNMVFSRDDSYMKHQLAAARQCAAQEGLGELPLYVTEWSSGISNRDMMHDDCFKGAYVVKNVLDSIGMAEMLGYWIGSDLFSEYYDSTLLLNGAAGLLTKNGIRKPAFYAFQFLNELERYLIEHEENYMITGDSRDSYNILAYNYKHFNVKYYLQELDIMKTDLRQFYEDCDEVSLHLPLTDIRPGKYKLKVSRVCAGHGSVLDEWRKMQQLHVVRKDELEYLKYICNPDVAMYYVQSQGSTLTLDLDLAPQEIVSVRISLDFESVLL